MATVWSLLDDSWGVLRDLLGELNHGPSGKIGKDNRLVSGKVLTSVRQEVLAAARQRTATAHPPPPTRVLFFLLRQWLFLWDPYTNLYLLFIRD